METSTTRATSRPEEPSFGAPRLGEPLFGAQRLLGGTTGAPVPPMKTTLPRWEGFFTNVFNFKLNSIRGIALHNPGTEWGMSPTMIHGWRQDDKGVAE